MSERRTGLARRRRMVGYTQDSLAEHVDVALSSVKRWEGGRTTPQPALRRRLANALDITVDELEELLTHDDHATPPARSTSPRADGGVTMSDDSWPSAPESRDDGPETAEDHRAFLTRAALLAVTGPQRAATTHLGPTPLRSPVDGDTVQRVRELTGALRLIDARYGGGACRAAAAAHLSWARPLLDAAPAALRQPLCAAVAEIHALIGWTALDVGARHDARWHLLTALELAQQAGDRALAAEVLYRMARIFLHAGRPADALELLRLGQQTARESASPLALTVLHGNAAWVYAELGDVAQMRRSLSAAEDSFGRVEPAAERWFRFFIPADLDALRGIALTTLTAGDRRHVDGAVEALQRAVAGRDDDTGRSRAFELTALATSYLRGGDVTLGVNAGHEAVDLALRIRSTRIVDRFAPLMQAAADRRGDNDVEDLRARLNALRP
jgi:transcriptional regulator with XRE-family HTH domain/tetratricopeptide (TPR) repeat protein